MHGEQLLVLILLQKINDSMRSKLFFIFVFLLLGLYVVISEPAGTPDPEQPEKNQQQVLHFWGVYDLPEVYEPIIQAFERRNPDVRVQYRQFPDFQEYHDITLKQLEQGKGPDVFLFLPQHFDFYDGFIAATNPTRAEGFIPAAVQELTKDKLLYGLPMWADALVMYYNKRYYDGIAASWEDFGNQTRDISIAGVAMGRLDNTISGWDILKTLFLQNQVDLTGLADDNLIATLNAFLRFAYPIDPFFNWNDRLLRPSYTDLEIDSFMRKKVAAIAGFGSLWDLFQAKSLQMNDRGADHLRLDDIGVGLMPQLNTESPAHLGKYAVVSSSLRSKNPQLAWEFIDFLTNEENQLYYMRATGRMPGRMLDHENLSERERVLLEALPSLKSLWIKPSTQKLIEEALQRGLKDRSLLDEIKGQPL